MKNFVRAFRVKNQRGELLPQLLVYHSTCLKLLTPRTSNETIKSHDKATFPPHWLFCNASLGTQKGYSWLWQIILIDRNTATGWREDSSLTSKGESFHIAYQSSRISVSFLKQSLFTSSTGWNKTFLKQMELLSSFFLFIGKKMEIR